MTTRLAGRPGRPFPRRAAVRASLVVVAFLALTSTPYAIAAARTPAGERFAGLILNYPDQHWYLTVQRSVAAGTERQNRYTTEAEAPVLVSPLYVVQGVLQRLLGLPLLVVYHGVRFLLALALPCIAFWFYRTAFPSETWTASWATLLALFNVGAGTLLGYLPIGFAARASDWKVPESNSLVTAAVFPHIVLAQAGLVVLFGSLLCARHRRSPVQVGVVAAVGSLLVSASHPFLLAPFMVAAALLTLGFGVGAAVRREAVGPALRLVLAPVVAAVVAAPFVLELLRQNRLYERLDGRPYAVTYSDSWWTWLTGYGLLVPLALVGLTAAVAYRHRLDSVAVFVVWMLAQVPLLYGFTNFERRFAEGLVFPIAGLAALGVAALRSRLRTSPALVTAVLLAFLLPAAMVASGRLGFTGMYLSDDYRDAFRRVGRDDVVLAGDYAATILPGQTDATTFVGRDILTIAWGRKAEERRRFSLDPASAQSLEWLHDGGVTALIVDRLDPTLVVDQARLTPPCFAPVPATGTVRVYRVNPRCGARADGPPAGSRDRRAGRRAG